MKYFENHPNQKLILAVAILGLFFGGSFWLSSQRDLLKEPEKSEETEEATPEKAKSQTVDIVYPISDYKKRILYRWFGKYVNASDKVPDCGAVFTGFHNADDLEVTASEKTKDVPVYAIATGKVRFAGYVNGYGGLLVVEVKRAGEAFLTSYGHIRLSSVSKKVGESVESGEPIATLGTGCSAETGGERKHLHFAIRKGNTIDYRGYLSSRTQLSDWVKPQEFLQSLQQEK